MKARLHLNDCIALAKGLYQTETRQEMASDTAVFALLHRASGKAIKNVRTERLERLPDNIATAFLWTAILAGKRNIDLEAEVWNAYPGKCPYCEQPTCACNQKGAMPQRAEMKPVSHARPRTVRGFQSLHARIYPPVNALDTIGHLAEELAELNAAFYQNGSGFRLTTRVHAAFEDTLKVEIVDVISHFFKLASFTAIDVETVLLGRSVKGCHQCGANPCRCALEDFLGDSHK